MLRTWLCHSRRKEERVRARALVSCFGRDLERMVQDPYTSKTHFGTGGATVRRDPRLIPHRSEPQGRLRLAKTGNYFGELAVISNIATYGLGLITHHYVPKAADGYT